MLVPRWGVDDDAGATMGGGVQIQMGVWGAPWCVDRVVARVRAARILKLFALPHMLPGWLAPPPPPPCNFVETVLFPGACPRLLHHRSLLRVQGGGGPCAPACGAPNPVLPHRVPPHPAQRRARAVPDLRGHHGAGQRCGCGGCVGSHEGGCVGGWVCRCVGVWVRGCVVRGRAGFGFPLPSSLPPLLSGFTAGCYCMSAFFSTTGSANMFASL
jgi:hypothetical protein